MPANRHCANATFVPSRVRLEMLLLAWIREGVPSPSEKWNAVVEHKDRLRRVIIAVVVFKRWEKDGQVSREVCMSFCGYCCYRMRLCLKWCQTTSQHCHQLSEDATVTLSKWLHLHIWIPGALAVIRNILYIKRTQYNNRNKFRRLLFPPPVALRKP